MHGTQGKKTPLLKQLGQRCRQRDAALQEGHREERPWRARRPRQEPQAGDRDRIVEGTQEGQEGPEEGFEAQERQEDVQEIVEDVVQEIIEQEIIEAQIIQTVALTGLRSCSPA
ncbi:hypothetical protein JQ571_04895 [Bradyrhizobium liaoningense]|nr:hypothetical protein [Bradyrhizobium liaoningense]